MEVTAAAEIKLKREDFVTVLQKTIEEVKQKFDVKNVALFVKNQKHEVDFNLVVYVYPIPNDTKIITIG